MRYLIEGFNFRIDDEIQTLQLISYLQTLVEVGFSAGEFFNIDVDGSDETQQVGLQGQRLFATSMVIRNLNKESYF